MLALHHPKPGDVISDLQGRSTHEERGASFSSICFPPAKCLLITPEVVSGGWKGSGGFPAVSIRISFITLRFSGGLHCVKFRKAQ